MEVNEALELITQATRAVQTNYETHAKIQQALEVIKKAIADKPQI